MADEQDLEALKSGDLDMARRDFRGADLSGMDLRGRDFSGAHFEGAKVSHANFAGSDLKGAHLTNIVAEGADFSDVKADGTVFVHVNFRGAKFDRAQLSASHFTKANFAGASFLASDFRKARLNEGTDFSGCATDAATRFDGVVIFRPLAREAAFRFYRVERGALVRLEDPGLAASNDPPVRQLDERKDVEAIRLAATKALEALAAVAPLDVDSSSVAGVGHNSPPADAALTRDDYDALTATLVVLRERPQELDQSLLRSSKVTVAAAGAKIAVWIKAKAIQIEEAFFTQVGTSLADPHRLLVAWLAVSGHLSEVMGAVAAMLGGG